MLPEARRSEREGGARHAEREMVHASDFPWRRPFCVDARLIREHRQQPPVPRIEIQMILIGLSEIRLLEEVRHPEHPFPEVDGALARGADDGNVVRELHLNLSHTGDQSEESNQTAIGRMVGIPARSISHATTYATLNMPKIAT